MLIHDWSQMDAGVFHDFHQSWMVGIRQALNTVGLSSEYYALFEMPNATTEQEIFDEVFSDERLDERGYPLEVTEEDERQIYALKKNVLGIHRTADDRQVARIEAAVPGNKSSRQAWRKFQARIARSLNRGLNLLLLDVVPPTTFAPTSLHDAICADLCVDSNDVPERLFAFGAYRSGNEVQAIVETRNVGDPLPIASLFLSPTHTVQIDFGEAYSKALAGMPRHLRERLELALENEVS
jgi:hypothetical protein